MGYVTAIFLFLALVIHWPLWPGVPAAWVFAVIWLILFVYEKSGHKVP